MAMEARGVGPWDTSDYEFPSLAERLRFAGLGTWADNQTLARDVTDGNRKQSKGGGYTTVPSQGGGWEVEMQAGSGSGKL